MSSKYFQAGLLLSIFVLNLSYASSNGAQTDSMAGVEFKGGEAISKIVRKDSIKGKKKVDGVEVYGLKMSGKKRMAFYLDGNVFIGTWIGKDGKLMNRDLIASTDLFPVEDLTAKWSEIESAVALSEGADKKSAKHELVVVMEPNCPHCHTFWQTLHKEMKDAQDLRVNYVLGSFLRAYTPLQIESILSQKNPIEGLYEHEERYDEGGIDKAESVSDATKEKIQQAKNLMNDLGITGVPALIYKDRSGKVYIPEDATSPQGLKKLLEN